MVRVKLRGWLVGAMAALALPLSGLAVLAGPSPASADAVMGQVTDLGEHDIDVNGTPTPEFFWNASFGSRYLYMTAVVPGSPPGRELSAVDLANGQYVGDWALPQGTEPNDNLVADGDTVWASSRMLSQDTQVFKVGQANPIADFPNTSAVAIVDGRAYVFGDGTTTPAVTVIDDDPNSAGYLTPIATPTPPSWLDEPTAVTSGGNQLFVQDGSSVVAVDADPTSPTYLTTTGTAPAPSSDVWLAADAGGQRLLSWDGEGAISVYSAGGGQLVADGSLDACASTCNGILAALSPDGRRAYVTTGDVADEVRVYDMTTPSHPQLAAIESFDGARTSALGLSPDGTQLTTGGEYPKIATVRGFASTPVVTAPSVPLPGDTLSVDLGDWSPTAIWHWQRNGRPIPGTAGATTYKVTTADLGARLTVAATSAVDTRTSTPVTVARAPRLTATVSGQRRAGWYRGRALIRFTCTPGTGQIAHCPAPLTLHAGHNQRARGTVTDQFGLSATATRSGIDVCDRCVTGAGYASGRWVLDHGRRYTVAIVGGRRPRAVGVTRPGHAATYRPIDARRGASVAGRPVWLFGVTAPTGRGHWSLHYRHGRTTTRIPLTVR